MITAIESLQGAWQIESLELAGAPVGASGRIVIDQNHFTSTGMGAEYTGRLELTSPNKITLHFETGPEAGNANHGIYEITPTGWRLCLNMSGGPAPKAFKSSKNHALETLARANPAQAGPRHPIPELQGEWQMQSCLRAGEPLMPSLVKAGVRKITGVESTLHFGPQLFQQGTFSKSDDAPNTFQLESDGALQRGIYELRGKKPQNLPRSSQPPSPGNLPVHQRGRRNPHHLAPPLTSRNPRPPEPEHRQSKNRSIISFHNGCPAALTEHPATRRHRERVRHRRNPHPPEPDHQRSENRRHLQIPQLVHRHPKQPSPNTLTTRRR